MNDLLFDAPWWILAVALAAGIAVWWSGNNRQDATLKRVGLGILAIALLWSVLSFVIDTDKEKAVRHTRELVAAVNQRDWAKFASILDAHTSFVPLYGDRDHIVAGAKDGAERIGLKSVRIMGMDVQQKDTVITVDFNAYSEQDRSGGTPAITSWRFDRQNLGTGWKLRTITPLPSAQVKVDEILRNLPR